MPNPTLPQLIENLRAAVHKQNRTAADRAVAGLALRNFELHLRPGQELSGPAADALGSALDLVSPERLRDTVVLLLVAVDNLTRPDSMRVRVHLRFIERLQERVVERAEPAAVDALIHMTEELDGTPNVRPDVQVVVGTYRALAWTSRYTSAHGTVDDLSRAVDAWRSTEQRAAKDAPEAPGRLQAISMLASCLAMRGERTASDADIDDAVDAAERALDLAERTDPADCPEYQESLARNLLWRQESRPDRGDLDRAQHLAEEALAAAPDDAERLRTLGDVLRQRSVTEPDQDTLRRAIALFRRARSDDPHLRASLGMTLGDLYDLTDDSAHLQESNDLIRAAIRDTPLREPVRVRYLCTLGVGLIRYFQRHDSTAALEEAIETLREGMAVSDDGHPAHLNLADALAHALELRSRTRGGAPTDLADAVELQRTVVAGSRPGSTRQAGAKTSLSMLLRWEHRAKDAEAQVTQFGEQAFAELLRTGAFTFPSAAPPGTSDLESLREAVRLARTAVAETPPGSLQATRLSSLGRAQEELFQATKDPDDRVRAVRSLSDAGRSSDATAHIRAIASRAWGRLAAEAGDWADAADAYGIAVRAYAELGGAALERGDLEANLKIYPHLATHAAVSVLRHTGDAAAAVEVLEAGRGVLLAQALDQGTHADPASGRSGAPAEPVGPPVVPSHVAEAGPVVAVNVNQYGCHALLVTAEGVSSVQLTDLTATAVEEKAGAFITALHILRGGDRFDTVDRMAASRFVSRTLGWLWDTVAEPVLAALDLASVPPEGSRLPRLWLMPTGPMGLLPLHAAGHHTAADGRTLIDRAVPSYTPTLRALQHSRRRAAPGSAREPVRPLAVCVSQLPGAPELPAAEQEISSLRLRFTGLRELRNDEACRVAVQAALADSDWAHFACHATSNPDQPSASRLHLADGPLTVADLVGIRAPDAYLAYLSACGTGRPGTDLPDEVIHLSSAFQQVGYPHVISTLWPIGDTAAATIAEDTYREMLVHGTEPARAVHAAIRRLRDTKKGYQPHDWASHIHTGP